jgi:hypothetical protein
VSRSFRYTWLEHVTSTASPAGSTQRLVAYVLGDYMRSEEATAWPSIATIAGRTRLSPRAVQNALHGLVELDLLAVAREGKGTSVTYRAVLPTHEVPTHLGTSCLPTSVPPRHLVPGTSAPRSETTAPGAPEPVITGEGTRNARASDGVTATPLKAAPPNASREKVCPFCLTGVAGDTDAVRAHVIAKHRDRRRAVKRELVADGMHVFPDGTECANCGFDGDLCFGRHDRDWPQCTTCLIHKRVYRRIQPCQRCGDDNLCAWSMRAGAWICSNCFDATSEIKDAAA